MSIFHKGGLSGAVALTMWLAASSAAGAAPVSVTSPTRIRPAPATADRAATATLLPEGYFVDAAGSPRRFSLTYDQWSSRRYADPHYVRAAAEMLGLLGAGLAYYWIKADQNKEDWEFPNLKDRLLTFDAVRFDNNLFITNHVLHGASGAGYYSFSRANGLSVPASILYSFATSTVFEWGFEWLEKVSINDLIYTPMGGFAPGEWFNQFGGYLNSAPGGGNFGNQLAAATLGFPRYVHKKLDGDKLPPALPTDSLGLSTAYYHRFDIGYGFAAADNNLGRSGVQHDVNIQARVVNMPGFLRPGRFATDFGNGNFTDMRMRFSFDSSGWADADLFFEADLAGYYAQEFRPLASGIGGEASMYAVATAVRVIDDFSLGRRDTLALAHMLGPSAKWWFAGGGALLRLDASVSGDFAAVRSLPYREWEGLFGSTGTKTVLEKYSYYFAYGASARAGARLSYGGLDVGGRGAVGMYDSIDGLDRYQQYVSRDVHNRDQLLEAEAWIGYTPPRTPVHFGLYGRQMWRHSEMKPLSESRWDRRLAIRLGFRF